MKAEEARNYLVARVEAEISSIADALILKAKEGDVRAIRELFDRAWGRPTVSQNDANEPVKIVIVPGTRLAVARRTDLINGGFHLGERYSCLRSGILSIDACLSRTLHVLVDVISCGYIEKCSCSSEIIGTIKE